MELIKEISLKDLGYDNNTDSKKTYRLRKASRAIVINDENKMALLFVSKHNYHKLPGGGIEHGEDRETALKREVMEETGCSIKIKKDIGLIIEYRDDMLQISYCYLAEVYGDMKTPSFTDKERSDGFRIRWVTIYDAMKLLKNDRPKTQSGKFIQKRDLAFIEKYMGII